ncbi:hypothetical protein G6F56_013321 [Rhizopus delemar]|nr:hypothetical protein G6F56_013321 [Rhizopus delemar]
MKGLDSMPSYQVGDQVEAIKSGVEEWYCARVVDVMYDKNLVSVFIHYEGWPPDEADWISPDLIRLHLPRTSFQYGPKGAENKKSYWSCSR